MGKITAFYANIARRQTWCLKLHSTRPTAALRSLLFVGKSAKTREKIKIMALRIGLLSH
jgi:hypothetical protein